MHESKWIWVVFDTSQYQKYYRDVHDLLAMPPGWVFRYNYRDTHMSGDALQKAASDATKPILLSSFTLRRKCPMQESTTRASFQRVTSQSGLWLPAQE